MTISRDTTVTASGTGPTSPIFADDFSCLIVFSSGWGEAKVEISGDNITWVDLEDSSGVVNLTGNKGLQVYGGLFYRLNVTTYSQPITASLYRLMK